MCEESQRTEHRLSAGLGRYYLSRLAGDMEKFAQAVRGHWGLDVQMGGKATAGRARATRRKPWSRSAGWR